MNASICLAKSSRESLWSISVLPLVLLLSGCASQLAEFPGHLTPVPSEKHQIAEMEGLDDASLVRVQPRRLPALQVSEWQGENQDKWQRLGVGAQDTTLNVDAMPLSRFIQTSLGDVLGLSFIVDPAVQSRQDLVTLRISNPMTARNLLDTIEQVLAGYKVGLSFEGDMLEVLPEGKLVSLAPTFVGPRSRIAIQQGKIMTIIPLRYSSPEEAMRFARFFLKGGVGTTTDVLRRLNSLMVIGDASQIARFQAVIDMVDQPTMVGRELRVFRPIYWQAGEIVDLLKDALKTQGVVVAEQPEAPGVYLSEVKQMNSLIVAAHEESVLEWIEDWVKALDTPDVAGETLRSFVYPVKHSTADEMGKLVSKVLGGFSGAGSDSAEDDSRSTVTSGAMGGEGPGLRMVVDEPHNALVFVGSAQAYKAVYQLLEQIDVPAKQVLLEVTVADVTLENNMQLGVEWQFDHRGADGVLDHVGGTLGALGIGSAGFSYTEFDNSGDIRAKLNALATKGDARILSSPRLLAVDNEEARIQVGTQIAVISSENTSDSVDGIIRSFNYVDTGVILSFTPTVLSANQVRLAVSQEVSVPGPSADNTPPINTRSVETTLIAQSGSTIMIGGLISTTDTVSDEQVPFLGDIPFFGALFRGREVIDNSTEMIVLITPHIIESSAQLEELTEDFRSKIAWP